MSVLREFLQKNHVSDSIISEVFDQIEKEKSESWNDGFTFHMRSVIKRKAMHDERMGRHAKRLIDHISDLTHGTKPNHK